MANLILDRLTIYGLDYIPTVITVEDKSFYPQTRPFTQIIDVIGLHLPMNSNHRITWNVTESSGNNIVDVSLIGPKYRVDCYPDVGKINNDFIDEHKRMRPILVCCRSISITGRRTKIDVLMIQSVEQSRVFTDVE
jgi:hypothetical protein